MINFKASLKKFQRDLRTTTGRNVLTFLVFLLISTIFWFLMALNDEVQEDFKVPLRLENFPSDMTIISGNIPTVSVTIKDKGSALTKFVWGSTPTLRIHYDQFSRPTDNHLLLTESQLNSAIRGVFGSSASIVAIRPDSLHLYFTTNPGIPVKVVVDADISTLPQYETFGASRVSADSVLLYSNLKERTRIRELTTVPISLTDLSDTTTVEARLIVPDGMRAIPPTVKVTFPVEPLVSKTRKLKIEAINVPAGTRLIPFPALIEVTYLLPKSLYTHSTSPLRAVVDYNDIHPGVAKIPLRIVNVPSYYKSATPAMSEVEFLIEKE